MKKEEGLHNGDSCDVGDDVPVASGEKARKGFAAVTVATSATVCRWRQARWRGSVSFRRGRKLGK